MADPPTISQSELPSLSLMPETQRRLLAGLFVDPLPASVYVAGVESAERAAVTLDPILTDLSSTGRARVVRVSPRSSPTVPLMASRILRQLGAKKAYDPRLDPARLVARLGPLVRQTGPVILRIDQAERIPDTWAGDVLEILLRLDEFCQCEGKLCVLFVSRVPFTRLHTLSGRATLLAPIEIVLPPVGQEEALEYAMQWSGDLLSHVQQDRSEANLKALRAALATAISTFSSETSDLGELRALCITLFLAGWARLGSEQFPTASKLLTHKDLFSDIMADVAPRIHMPDDFCNWATAKDAKKLDGRNDEAGARQHSVLAAYILLAAYVAGFNPARHDMRFFAQHVGGVQRAGRQGQDDEAFAEQLSRPQLAGPRMVPLERLLAVLESLLSSEQPPELLSLIVSDTRPDAATQGKEHIPWRAISRSAAPLEQIAALVQSGHLVQLRPGLDRPQYRATLSWDEVQALASLHHVDIRERLWNWR